MTQTDDRLQGQLQRMESLGRGDDVGLSLAAATVTARVAAPATGHVRIDPR